MEQKNPISPKIQKFPQNFLSAPVSHHFFFFNFPFISYCLWSKQLESSKLLVEYKNVKKKFSKNSEKCKKCRKYKEVIKSFFLINIKIDGLIILAFAFTRLLKINKMCLVNENLKAWRAFHAKKCLDFV